MERTNKCTPSYKVDVLESFTGKVVLALGSGGGSELKPLCALSPTICCADFRPGHHVVGLQLQVHIFTMPSPTEFRIHSLISHKSQNWVFGPGLSHVYPEPNHSHWGDEMHCLTSLRSNDLGHVEWWGWGVGSQKNKGSHHAKVRCWTTKIINVHLSL